jgi:chaperonin GroEL
MFKEMAGKVSKQCGDGTTTAIVLARYISSRVLRAMSSGLDPNGLRTGIELATETAVEDLERRAKSCADERSIVQIAATASNGDLSVGELLAAAFKKVGPNGVVNVNLGNGINDEIEFQEGARWEQGWRSPYFMTDKTRRIAELTDSYVLLYDRPIKELDELVPILEQIQKAKGSLLIIADEVEDAALTGLLLNHIRCVLKVIVVKPPAYGDRRKETLADLAYLLGGRAILEEKGDDLSQVKLADLGRVKRVQVTESSTTLIGGGGNESDIEERLLALRFEVERLQNTDKGSPTGKVHDIDELEERISNLSKITATINVGGGSEPEMKERLQRVENARNAVLAALAEGGLPGGGAGLLRCRKALNGLSSADIAIKQGIQIVTDALREPARLIADNAGHDSFAIIHETLASDDELFGFDARAARFGNLFEAGVIDPLRVTRLALQFAAVTASTLMTTECVVANLPPDDPTFGYTPEWAAATREDPRV